MEFIYSARTLSQRIAVLVDVQNMFYSAKNLKQAKIDYGRLLREITGDRHLIRAIAYVLQKEDIDQSSFHEALSRFGYDLKIKELKVRVDDDGKAIIGKGSWNVGLTVDAMLLSNKVDTVVLVTGDGEYVPLVGALKSMGCRVEVVGFERSTAAELIKTIDQFIQVQDSWMFKEKKFEKEQEEEEGKEDNRILGSTAAGQTVIEGLPKDEDETTSKFGIFD